MKRWSAVCIAEKLIGLTNHVEVTHDVTLMAANEEEARGKVLAAAWKKLPGYRICNIHVLEIVPLAAEGGASGDQPAGHPIAVA